MAALNRLRRASTAAGLSTDVAKRKLFLIRNGPWSAGVKTQQALREFRRAGGVTLSVDPELVVGYGYQDGKPVPIPLETLRKHVVIFAGSGSGKTVLIRRLVEDCALQSVSAIVLDPNNDLARLGDPWPEPPSS